MQLEPLDYRRPTVNAEAGQRSAHKAYVLVTIAACATFVGAILQYHSQAFSSDSFIGGVGFLVSWGCAVAGIVQGIIATRASRGRCGIVPFVISALILVVSVILANELPSYGLGNIH
jgi:hypothetical protein